MFNLLKRLFRRQPAAPLKPSGFWYLEHTPGARRDHRLWTNRETLIQAMQAGCPRMERVTPPMLHEPPDRCLYRWWDETAIRPNFETTDPGDWKYFLICRAVEEEE